MQQMICFVLDLDPFYRTGNACIIFAVTIRPLAFPMRALHKRILIKFDIVELTLRRLMSHIYGAPILDVSRSHTTTQHSR